MVVAIARRTDMKNYMVFKAVMTLFLWVVGMGVICHAIKDKTLRGPSAYNLQLVTYLLLTKRN